MTQKADISELKLQLSSRSVVARSEAIKSLSDYLAKAGNARPLLSALRDRNEIVRVEGCEALAQIGDSAALKRLQRVLMKDESSLVRGYAAAAIGVLGGEDDLATLRRAASREHSSEALVGIYVGMASLGDGEGWRRIIGLLKSRRHRVRCAAARNVVPFVDKRNRRDVLGCLKNVLKNEPTRAVRSALRESIASIARRK
jgi:HEAT repeat protein